jgi:hypothetical protein
MYMYVIGVIAAKWIAPLMRQGSILIIKCGVNGARAYAGGVLVNESASLLHHQPSLQVSIDTPTT